MEGDAYIKIIPTSINPSICGEEVLSFPIQHPLRDMLVFRSKILFSQVGWARRSCPRTKEPSNLMS
jgi:hypothetical protein